MSDIPKDLYRLVSLEEAIAAIDTTQDLAFDTETARAKGKYSKICLAQFYQRGWDKALLVQNPNPYVLFGFMSQAPDCNIVMQYAHYDISTIQNQIGGHFEPKKYSDTFLLARIAYPHLSEYKLDVLVTYLLDFDPYAKAGIDKKEMQNANYDIPVIPHKQLVYAALDVYYLLDLYDNIKVQEESMSYRLDKHALSYALEFQRVGMPVDKSRLLEMYKKNQKEIAEIALPINANSYQQVRPYIGSDESDDLGLARLSLAGNQRAIAVRRTRKLLKQNSFLSKFDTEDGRIYGRFAPSARSGRFTCSDQNLEQLPRACKPVFGLNPETRRCLAYADYSQLELRCIGAITGDPTIIQLYSEGRDLHDYTASFIFGDTFTKLERQIAKTANFNLVYGGGAGMFQKILLKEAGIWLEIDAISRIIRKWKRLYKEVTKWQERGIRDYQRGSLGSTPLGRQYRGRLMTDQLNIENQGAGAEVAKLSMHYMRPKLKEYDAQMCNFIHDAYITEQDCKPEVFEPVAKIIGDCMHEAWTEMSKMFLVTDLPMPVNVYVGYNWGDIEAGDYFHEYKIKG